MTVPLPLSPGRSGFTPSLQLAYDSGSGNGPFGFGWSLGIPAITRKTDKGLPLYCDGDESDVFILAGAEDLVPILDPAGDRADANPDGVRHTVPDRPVPPAHRRPVLPHRALDRDRHGPQPLADDLPATTSPRSTAPTPRARSPTPPTRRRSSPGRSAGPGTTRATRRSTATPPKTAPGSTWPRRTKPTAPPQAAPPRSTSRPSSTGTSSPTSPTGPRRRRRALPRGLDVLRGPRLRRPRRDAAGAATRPALAAAPRPVLHLPGRIRGPDLPAGPAAPVLQQLPRGADGRPGLPRPVARPGLLRPAGPRRSPQPDLHLPHLGDPDRLPARRRRASPAGRCRRSSSTTASRKSSPPS